MAPRQPAFATGAADPQVHVSKWWMKDELHVHNLGLLYHMLFASGFELEVGQERGREGGREGERERERS